MTEECKLSFLSSSWYDPLESGLQGLLEGITCGSNPGAVVGMAGGSCLRYPQSCSCSCPAPPALGVTLWRLLGCSHTPPVSAAGCALGWGVGDAPVVPVLWDHPVPLLAMTVPTLGGPLSSWWGSSWMRADPCRSLASSSDPSDPIWLFLWGEQGSVPLPSISEHPWGTSAGLSCPQQHPWLGDPPRAGGTVGLAQWGQLLCCGGAVGGPLCLPLLWAGDGDAALVEPGRGRVSSRALPGVCPIS